jgi:RNA polymerase sigma-70 factor, ECF subfamily
MERHSLNAAMLFQHYAGPVARYLRHLGVRRQDCDDLVQEVFLVAHLRGGFEPGSASPFTWLAEIAWRIALADRRRRRRLGEILDEVTVANVVERVASPAETLEAVEDRDRVRAALAAMDSDQRNILVSFELEGRLCESIAGDLGVPIGTVYSRIHTARKDLARALQRALRQPM